MTTDAEDQAWELAEEFERAARTSAAGPSRELTAAVATAADEQVRTTLLLAMHAFGSDDHEVARRYAKHLVVLAALLPEAERRRMLAGVDLILAEVAATADEWAEATLRITRAGPDIEDLLPGALADWAWVMGGCAEHDGRIGEARELWIGARELFAADERWFEAAVACAGLAALGGGDDDVERALADWSEAADLYVAADEPDLARECVDGAVELVTRTILAMQTGDEARIHPLACAVRELALRHGDVESAAEMARIAGIAGPAAGLTLDEVRPLFTAARDGYRSLDADPRKTRIDLAWVDKGEAGALMSRGRLRDAEPLLHAAIRAFRDEEMPEAVASCETMLVNVLCFVEQDLERVSRVVANQQWDGDRNRATAAMLRAFALARDGRVAESLAAFAEAGELAIAAGEPFDAIGFTGLAAMVALVHGDTGPAELSVAEIDRYLAQNASELPVDKARGLSSIQLYLQAELAGRNGDQDALLALVRRLEDRLVSFDLGLLAAMIILRAARMLAEAGLYRDALRAALPAVLALDAVRFTLPDAERRSRWTAAVTHGFDTAFRSAAACGDTRLVAELIEVARSNAVPLPRGGSGAGTSDDLAASLGALLAETGQLGGPVAVGSAPVGVLSGAGALAGGENRTALGLPAHLRTPWGTIALAEHLQRARRYHDPVRADVAVDWRVREVSP